MKFARKFGVVYENGKLLFFAANKLGQFDNPRQPSWAVDIREILAMTFAGFGALCLILKGYITEAMYLLIAITSYATGRTIPGGKPQISYEDLKKLLEDEKRRMSP